MDVQAKPCYKRILLKLSGEALMGEDSFGINRAVLQHMIEELRTALDLGVQVGIVVGGGNIFRGVALGATGMDRATGDYMGMLATVMNAMALQDCCRNNGIEARVQSALNIEQVAEPYIRGAASSASRPRCYFRRRHGQSLYDHGYDRSAARRGSGCRYRSQGH